MRTMMTPLPQGYISPEHLVPDFAALPLISEVWGRTFLVSWNSRVFECHILGLGILLLLLCSLRI
jgi:hypothetical protein